MSYQNTGTGIGKKVATIAAALLIAGFVKVAVREAISEGRFYTTDWSAEFDKSVDGQAALRPMYAALRTSFPTEFASFKAKMIEGMKARQTGATMRQGGYAWMSAFSALHKGDLAQAPHAELAAFRQSQISAAEAFQAESDVLCGHFVVTGFTSADQPSEAALPSLGQVGAARVQAAAAGITAPAHRSLTMADADWITFFKALKASGVDDAGLRLFATPGALASAPASQQCDVGLKMLKAIDTLPADRADNLTGYLAVNA